jgi:hypothetical protein
MPPIANRRQPCGRHTVRGWSHFALEHASVGFVQSATEFLLDAEEADGGLIHLAAVVALPCDPGVGWRITARDLAAFGCDPSESDKAWHALVEHDALIYERAWFRFARESKQPDPRRELIVLKESGQPQYVTRRLAALCDELGIFLRRGLARRADVEHPHGSDGLRGGAETAWVHLAARLGRTLPKWLDDGHGASRALRVCELTGMAFRATCRATLHPALPRQPARLKRSGPIKRVGTRFPPVDPFAPYAREVWFPASCARCGEPFEAQHAATIYCGACGPVSSSPARPGAR